MIGVARGRDFEAVKVGRRVFKDLLRLIKKILITKSIARKTLIIDKLHLVTWELRYKHFNNMQLVYAQCINFRVFEL